MWFFSKIIHWSFKHGEIKINVVWNGYLQKSVIYLQTSLSLTGLTIYCHMLIENFNENSQNVPSLKH